MKNNTFDLSRFGALLRHDLSVTSRTNLQYALFMAILAVVTGCICALTGSGPFASGMSDPSAANFSTAWLYIGGVFACISASLTFSHMSKPAERLSMLMIPASNLEKFISRFLIYNVGVIILAGITYLIGDLARIATLFFTDVPMSRVIAFGYHPLSALERYQFLSYLQYPAYFILGSIFFPRLAFIKTVGMIFLVSITSGLMTIFYMFRRIKEGIILTPTDDIVQDPNELIQMIFEKMWIFGVENAIFIVLLIILAYYRLKQTEIINRW